MRMQWVHPLHSVHVSVHAAAAMHEVLRVLCQPLCQTVTVLPPEDVPDGTRGVAPAGEHCSCEQHTLAAQTQPLASLSGIQSLQSDVFRKQGRCMQQAACTRCSLCDCGQEAACLNCGANLLCWEDSWPPTRYRMLTASHRSLCSAVTDAGLSGLQRRSQYVSTVAWGVCCWGRSTRGSILCPFPGTDTVLRFPCPGIQALSLYLFVHVPCASTVTVIRCTCPSTVLVQPSCQDAMQAAKGPTASAVYRDACLRQCRPGSPPLTDASLDVVLQALQQLHFTGP